MKYAMTSLLILAGGYRLQASSAGRYCKIQAAAAH
jgi:hypothetical protein